MFFNLINIAPFFNGEIAKCEVRKFFNLRSVDGFYVLVVV